MSKMKDLWGDTIEVFTAEDRVCIYFSERLFSPPKEANMELDADVQSERADASHLIPFDRKSSSFPAASLFRLNH